MAILFGSQDWVDALKKALETSQAYKEAAKNWEGDIYIIVDPDASYKNRHVLYLDLWHGECREASVIADENETSRKSRISFASMKPNPLTRISVYWNKAYYAMVQQPETVAAPCAQQLMPLVLVVMVQRPMSSTMALV